MGRSSVWPPPHAQPRTPLVREGERERDGAALQRPARSLPGSNARQLIPGCFPFPAGGAFPATLKMLCLLSTFLRRTPLCSSLRPHVSPRLRRCTVDSISLNLQSFYQQLILETLVAIRAESWSQKGVLHSS